MKNLPSIISAIAIVFSSCSTSFNTNKIISHAEQQTQLMLTEIPKTESNIKTEL